MRSPGKPAFLDWGSDASQCADLRSIGRLLVSQDLQSTDQNIEKPFTSGTGGKEEAQRAVHPSELKTSGAFCNSRG